MLIFIIFICGISLNSEYYNPRFLSCILYDYCLVYLQKAEEKPAGHMDINIPVHQKIKLEISKALIFSVLYVYRDLWFAVAINEPKLDFTLNLILIVISVKLFRHTNYIDF